MKKKLPLLFAMRQFLLRTAFACTVVTFFMTGVSFAQRQLLDDINTSAESDFVPYQQLKPALSYIFFVRYNELWSYKPGNLPIMLKKFRWIENLSISGNMAYFAANDGEHGTELWKSNGTVAGTVIVKDIVPGNGSSNPQSVLAAGSSKVFFTADNGVHGREIWKSSGVAASTVMIKDISNTGSSNPSNLRFTNNTLYFSADDGQRGNELWKSDGTSGGTSIVKDINTSPGVSSNPEQLTVVGSMVYFVLSDGTNKSRLWKSDGTATGTVQVKRIVPGHLSNLLGINNTLFFAADDGIHGHELWKSNGTAAGTVLIEDLGPDPDGSHPTSWADIGDMFAFTNVNGILFFFAVRGGEQFIVRSDGTAAGTYQVAPIEGVQINMPSPRFSYADDKVYFFNYGGDVSDEGDNRRYGVWTMNIDGSEFALLREYEQQPTYYENHDAYMIAYNNEIYLTGILFGGWKVLKQFASGANAILHETLTPSAGVLALRQEKTNRYLYFGTELLPPEYGYYIYRTDGTPAGTESIIDYAEYDFLAVGNNLYFSTEDNVYVRNDNFNSNVFLTSLAPTQWYQQRISNWYRVYNSAFFTTNAHEVWKTNGTPETTKLLKKFNNIVHAQESSRRLYIINQTTTGALELWRTHNDLFIKIKTFASGTVTPPYRQTSTYQDNVIYFVINDGVHGNEVWKSDGTTAGTYMIGDISSDVVEHGYEYGIARVMTLASEIYVSAQDEDENFKLYRFNGVELVPVADLPEVFDNMSNGTNHYLITRPERNTPYGNAVWHVDGTGLVTYVGDPGDGSISHTVISGKLYTASSFYHGINYVTPCQLQDLDIEPGFPISNINGKLFYISTWEQYGPEPSVYLNIGALATATCNTNARIATASTESEVPVRFAPNPFNDELRFTINGLNGERARMVVYTLAGRSIERMDDLEANIEYTVGDQWSPGMYIMKFEIDEKIVVEKVIKE